MQWLFLIFSGFDLDVSALKNSFLLGTVTFLLRVLGPNLRRLLLAGVLAFIGVMLCYNFNKTLVLSIPLFFFSIPRYLYDSLRCRFRQLGLWC